VIARLARIAGRVAAALAPAILVIAIFEGVLRAFPQLLPIEVGTAIYSVYGDQPGDIYFHDRPTRTMWMWPDYETRAYWNGHIWRHRTDELGFRNPPGLADRSIVLLGDSMIYGHGVNEEDTAAHFLRSEHGLSVYDAGRQGDCLYQEYLVARYLLPRLRPKTLVVTVFLNDFEDLAIYRTPEEIAAPPELALDADALAARLADPESSSKWSKQLHRSKLWRLLEMAWKKLRAPAPPSAPAGNAPDAPPAVPPMLLAMTDDARYAPVARYYETVIADLVARAKETGTEIVLLHLDVADQVVAGSIAGQDRVRALLEEIGRAHGLRVLATREVFAGCSECFLPNDGHLTREGNRRLAAFLARELEER
jgi:hypothetical protein